MNMILRHKPLFGLLLGIIIYGLIPVFIKSPYYLDLFIAVLVNAVLGMMFIMTLRTGMINMGVIPFLGFGAYASAILSTKLHLSVWACMPLATILTAVIALILGALLIGSGSGGLSFVMLTSVIGMIFSVLIGSTRFLGAWNGIPNIPPPEAIKLPFLTIEFVSKIPFFYLAMLIFLIVVLASNAFYSAWTGTACNAIGTNSRLAESIGINTSRYKLAAFVLSSTLCGLMGSFFAHYQTFVVPDSFGMWQNIYVQIYAILGGMSFATLGPLVGSAVMTFFPEMIRSTREAGPIFTGIILVLLIMFLPEGLLGVGKYRHNLIALKNAISSKFSKSKSGAKSI
jgi:branched-chain amino acid transport system permease protein